MPDRRRTAGDLHDTNWRSWSRHLAAAPRTTCGAPHQRAGAQSVSEGTVDYSGARLKWRPRATAQEQRRTNRETEQQRERQTRAREAHKRQGALDKVLDGRLAGRTGDINERFHGSYNTKRSAHSGALRVAEFSDRPSARR